MIINLVERKTGERFARYETDVCPRVGETIVLQKDVITQFGTTESFVFAVSGLSHEIEEIPFGKRSLHLTQIQIICYGEFCSMQKQSD